MPPKRKKVSAKRAAKPSIADEMRALAAERDALVAKLAAAPKRKRGGQTKLGTEPCPALSAALESVDAVNAWVTRQVATGALGTTAAKEITACTRTAVMSIRTREGLHELENLRRMLVEAKVIATARQKAAVDSRYSGDEGRISEFEVTADGAPVATDGAPAVAETN